MLGAQAVFIVWLSVLGGEAAVLATRYLNHMDGLVVSGVGLSQGSVIALVALSVATLGSRLVVRRPPSVQLAWLCIAWVAAAMVVSLVDRVPADFLVTQLLIAVVGLWGCRLNLGERTPTRG